MSAKDRDWLNKQMAKDQTEIAKEKTADNSAN
jgi:hypothetical protein